MLKFLYWFPRIVLSIIALFWFVFAMLSRAEGYGGGLKGIIYNSPNAIPWLILLVFVWLAWKYELIGGIIITILGFLTIFMFDVFNEPFALIAFTLPLMILGGMFTLHHYLVHKKITG